MLLPPWQAEDENAQPSLDNAIKTCSWDNIYRCLMDPDSAEDASHKLVHLRAKDDGPLHNSYETTLASKYVAGKVFERAGVARVQHLRELLMGTLGEASVNSAAGQMFELFAHHAIQEGGSFKASTLLRYSLGVPCNRCSWLKASKVGVWALGVGCWVLPMRVDQAECCMLRFSLQQAHPPSQHANARFMFALPLTACQHAFMFATSATGAPPVATWGTGVAAEAGSHCDSSLRRAQGRQ